MSHMLDIFKIGILLIGISSFMFAFMAAHWYYTIQTQQHRENYHSPFWARCEYKTIIIHANENLQNVTVRNWENKTLCIFDLIKSGSDELCFVNSTGVFLVETDNIKKAVTCVEIKEIHIAD